MRTRRMGAPSTRKETEIGNKDHPLCLRTVNGSSNVFNLSPESNNGAHSTPPRYCSTVRLKALGFYHPSLSQYLSASSLCVLFMKGLICGIRRRGGFVGDEEKKKNYREKRQVISGFKRWGPDEYTSVWFLGVISNSAPPPPFRVRMTPASELFHQFAQHQNSILQQRLSLVSSVLHLLTCQEVIYSSAAGGRKGVNYLDCEM